MKGYVIKLNIRKGLYYIKIEYSCQYAVSRGVGYIHKDCLTILYILVYIYRWFDIFFILAYDGGSVVMSFWFGCLSKIFRWQKKKDGLWYKKLCFFINKNSIVLFISVYRWMFMIFDWILFRGNNKEEQLITFIYYESLSIG